jgi:hypothetical protein
MKRLKGIIKENLDTGLEIGMDLAAETVIDGILGQIASGLVTAKLSYKQKRFEENVTLALNELKKRVERIEKALNDDNYQFVQNNLFPIMFDYVIEESEKEKISIIINGFENAMQSKYNNDEQLIRTYFDILKELRINELMFFIENYDPDKRELELKPPFLPLTKEDKIRYAQIKGYQSYVNNKLERLGLIKLVAYGEEEVFSPVSPITQLGYNFLNFFRSPE